MSNYTELPGICGWKGDPVCEPPNCSGACPQNMPDLRPDKIEASNLETGKDIAASFVIGVAIPVGAILIALIMKVILT